MLLEDAATWEGRSTTPREARALVEQVRMRGGHDEFVGTAVLLTSEVVTNAVEHAGGPLTVRAQCDDHVLRVEVIDAGSGVPQRAVVHEGAVSGRGMHLLDALATRWSTRPVAGGKVVWFELALT